jgi:hypothetical protein
MAATEPGKKKTNKWLIIVGIVVVVIVLASIAGGGEQGGSGGTTAAKEPEAAVAPAPPLAEVTIDTYKTKAAALDYRKAMLNDLRKGEMVSFAGTISQVVNDSNYMVLNDNGDQIFAAYEVKQKVLVGDSVKIYGKYDGTLKFESTTGEEVEVPQLSGEFIEVLAKR